MKGNVFNEGVLYPTKQTPGLQVDCFDPEKHRRSQRLY
jgi:hypothetical protein